MERIYIYIYIYTYYIYGTRRRYRTYCAHVFFCMGPAGANMNPVPLTTRCTGVLKIHIYVYITRCTIIILLLLFSSAYGSDSGMYMCMWTRIVYIEHIYMCRCRRARPFTTASADDPQYNTCATPVQVSTCVYVCVCVVHRRRLFVCVCVREESRHALMAPTYTYTVYIYIYYIFYMYKAPFFSLAHLATAAAGFT